MFPAVFAAMRPLPLGMPYAQQSRMMTALFVLFGLSATVTLFILAAFALNARTAGADTYIAECTEREASVSSSRPLVPAFSH